jgi:hypothetical protein
VLRQCYPRASPDSAFSLLFTHETHHLRNPVTHKFAILRLPDKFMDGDKLLIRPTERWFDSHEEAVAALPAAE